MLRHKLPTELAGLAELANDLSWVYSPDVQRLFQMMDPDAWALAPSPAGLLYHIGPERLARLAEDQVFLAHYDDVMEQRRAHLRAPLRYQDLFMETRFTSTSPLVAYFSMEFGLSQALPQYAGGLGVLAGDHLKTANDLGVPMVAVGLFYHNSFAQRVRYGVQSEDYHLVDPDNVGLVLTSVRVSVRLGDEILHAQVWRVQVGRITLLLLDTNIPENEPEMRGVTDRLYAGSHIHRLHQEILLGMGGVQALSALGYRPAIFHANEGHAAFMGLERIRVLMDEGATYDVAFEAVRSSTLFTTHTPVPAGIDRFPAQAVAEHLAWWAEGCDISIEDLLELGHLPGDAPEKWFNMAALALRLSGQANGVSELHGQVSRGMFAGVFGVSDPDEVPIGHVTNGVHLPTWVSPELQAFYRRTVGKDWWLQGPRLWSECLTEDAVPGHILWKMRCKARAELVAYVRAAKEMACRDNGWSEDAIAEAVAGLLDPDVLTVGFARRFATYKRATLLFKDTDRLLRIIGNPQRPVQFVFAGRAHPDDVEGKELILAVEKFSNQTGVRARFVFLPDYGMEMAAQLVRGCDVWLNTPVFGREASGTSGMKAAANGMVQLSRPDGWWYEMAEYGGGWSIGEPQRMGDEAVAEALFALLEGPVTAAFYDRGPDGIPWQWAELVRAAMLLTPRVSSTRMLEEYISRFYHPLAGVA